MSRRARARTGARGLMRTESQEVFPPLGASGRQSVMREPSMQLADGADPDSRLAWNGSVHW